MKFAKFLLTPPICAISAILLGACAADAAVYLKPLATDETREVQDGTSWSTACTTLADAYARLQELEDTEEARTLYVAQGIYSTKDNFTAVPFGALRIYGGYRAADDADMTRDPEEYQSIFCGISVSALKTAKWSREVPTLGGYGRTTVATTENILVDGKLNLIAPTGDFDAMSGPVSSSVKPIVFSGGTGGVVSGIKFTGYARDDHGTCIRIDKVNGVNCGTVLVENCTFAALASQMGAIGAAKNESTAVNVIVNVRNCVFHGINMTTSCGGVVCYNCTTASGTVEDCVFTGCWKADGYGMGSVVYTAGGKASVSRCVFTHCLTAYEINDGMNPLIGTSGTWTDCVVTNNFIAWVKRKNQTTMSFGPAIFSLSSGSATRCVFANNRVEAKPEGGTVTAMFGGGSVKSSGVYDACIFSDNVVAAPATVALAGGRYALAVAGCSADNSNPVFRNCVFEGNALEPAEAEGVTAVLCEGVLLGGKGESTVEHCTFVSPRADPDYAVAQFGSTQKALTVKDSVFELEDGEAWKRFVFADQPSTVTVANCQVRNMVAKYLPEDVDITEGLTTDPIPFVRTPLLFSDGTDTGWTLPMPDARTPGIRTTSDGAVRGAVNALSEKAENGATLVVRCTPYDGGTVDVPVQAVASGTAIAPVTATGNDATFLGWFTSDDEEYSTANPLTIASLDGDLVLTAKFGTAAVDVVFDLGEAGTFVESGESTITLSRAIGDPFPEIPAYVASDAYHIWGWDEMPKIVEAGGGTYRAKYVTKTVRTIEVKPGDDLAAALVDAGHYAGRVVMAAGTYEIGAPMTMPSNVSVEGDPAGGTVLNGNGGYSCFTDNDENVVTNIAFANLTFRDFARAAVSLTAGGDTVRFSGCTFDLCNTSQKTVIGDGFSYGAIHVESRAIEVSDSFFTNTCRAVYARQDSGNCTNLFRNCRFVDNFCGCVAVYAKWAGGFTHVSNCVFDLNRADRHDTGSVSVGPCVMTDVRGTQDTLIEDCVFTRTVSTGAAYPSIYLVGESTAKVWILRCRITDCTYTGNDNRNHRAGAVFFGNKSKPTLVKDCYFARNSVDNLNAANHAAGVFACNNLTKVLPTVVNCTFEDNVAHAAGTTAGTVVFGNYERGAFVNCAFISNRFSADTADGRRVGDLCKQEGGDQNSCRLQVINCAFAGGYDGYIPLGPVDQCTAAFGYCAFENYDASVFDASASVRLVKPLCDGVKIAKAESGENGVFAARVRPQIENRFAGYRQVYQIGDLVYVHSTAFSGNELKPWTRLADEAFYKENEISGGELIPDAWGVPRTKARCTIGPVSTPVGLMLMVR